MKVIDLTDDKNSIVEYIRYNTRFGEEIVNININQIEVSFNPDLVIINKGVGDGSLIIKFNYGDYKDWLRCKKIKNLRK